MIGLGADKDNCLKGWVKVCSVNSLSHVGPEGESHREKKPEKSADGEVSVISLLSPAIYVGIYDIV